MGGEEGGVRAGPGDPALLPLQNLRSGGPRSGCSQVSGLHILSSERVFKRNE